jgi:hypothetical protein
MTFYARQAKLQQAFCAGVAELADAQDLKSWAPYGACGFNSHPRYHVFNDLQPFIFLKKCQNGMTLPVTLPTALIRSVSHRVEISAL